MVRFIKKHVKKITSLALIGALTASALFYGVGDKAKTAEAKTDTTKTTTIGNTKTPKYIFFFIGDGMSFPQVQITSDYLGAIRQDASSTVLSGNKYLNFMKFETVGSAVTYDSSSFCPDSASTATSLSTGHKTYSGVINMDETKTVSYETIAEKVKSQLGYKVGIITSVNLNHATPAAYYAHQATRNNYYEIGVEMVKSGFDYFAGGELLSPNGAKNDQKNVYDLAKAAGYTVVKTQEEAAKLNSKSGKAIVIGETIADGGSISYDIDRKAEEWSLADYVRNGINVLDNDKGFFMMVEGGKIDWACHANDAGSTIKDTVALSNAVDAALSFYNKHKDETLIIVTGDHETGGLTIGFAGTNYDTFLTNLSNQKISFAKFDSTYVAKYKKENIPFESVMQDIKKNFGLRTSTDVDAAANPKLVLTTYEYNKLYDAYQKTIGKSNKTLSQQEEYVLYGTYEPLTVTITHILNNKSGINFSSYAHTGLPVPVFAKGAAADTFGGYYDNTDVYNKLASILKIK
ncbi:alkaline phosphatase [Anaerosporobacter sp.]|uniref:alkaline phosphatase n=1 Tax=Anaerosporobacter sp. TaxID=1872529 RepID=UPI00286FA081|nr:alkaline phosphatase [Anaerosporobacter sp.]